MELRREYNTLYCISNCSFEKHKIEDILKEWNKNKISNYLILDILIENYEINTDKFLINLENDEPINNKALCHDIFLNINPRTKQYIIYNFTCRSDLITEETKNYKRKNIFFNIYSKFLPEKYEFDKLIKDKPIEERTDLINIYDNIVYHDNIYNYIYNELTEKRNIDYMKDDSFYKRFFKNVDWSYIYESKNSTSKEEEFMKNCEDGIMPNLDLLNDSINPKSFIKEGIIRACRTGHLDLIKKFFELDIKNLLKEDLNFKFYALGEASSGGNLDIIEYLKPSRRDEINEILIKAIKYKKLNVFKLYFDLEDINLNLLVICCRYGSNEIFKYIIKNFKSSFKSSIFQDCFESVIYRGNTELFNLLVSSKIEFKEQLLSISINRNYTDISEILLKKFEKVKKINLSYAIDNKNSYLINLLLDTFDKRNDEDKEFLEDNFMNFIEFINYKDYDILIKYSNKILLKEVTEKLLINALSRAFKVDNLTSFKYLYFLNKNINNIIPTYNLTHIEMAIKEGLFDIFEYLYKMEIFNMPKEELIDLSNQYQRYDILEFIDKN